MTSFNTTDSLCHIDPYLPGTCLFYERKKKKKGTHLSVTVASRLPLIRLSSKSRKGRKFPPNRVMVVLSTNE